MNKELSNAEGLFKTERQVVEDFTTSNTNSGTLPIEVKTYENQTIQVTDITIFPYDLDGESLW